MNILRKTTPQNSAFWLMADLRFKQNGILTVLTPALVSVIAFYSYERQSNGTWSVVSGYNGVNLTVGNVVLSAPVSAADDPSWDARTDDGYNFQHEIPGAAIPNGSKTYQLVYRIILTDGRVGKCGPVIVETIPLATG